ncbi:PRD domain-containing protein [Salipaludibacillus sp. LMS25]|uniref:BglG family transcription antiterminator LicT n=1 Tax=Salipaludibacillus sp. LMS25 TaxID=2924031 RepID=UPI0020D1CF3B|nr:PRD domain-containing protein [Salipaludibacillus sp. LMS25]UTR16506.1 PRD domain-containing protein [Salipaludibacillus sp. LMS25]
MQVIKVFNNNVVLVKNADQVEEIVMGKGLGFGIKAGDSLKDSNITKKFVLENKDTARELESLLKRIDVKDIELASEIIQLYEDEFGNKINESALFALADHVSFALTRAKQGISFRSALEWEIKQLYGREYSTALKAVGLMQERTGIEIPEQEAAFITLHFVNSLGTRDGMEETVFIVKIIQSITNIIKYHYGCEFNEKSFYFTRFITHIRYFIKRQLNHEVVSEETSSLLNVVKLQYTNSYSCAVKIKEFLENQHNWMISDEEIVYLTLHLNKLASEK